MRCVEDLPSPEAEKLWGAEGKILMRCWSAGPCLFDHFDHFDPLIHRQSPTDARFQAGMKPRATVTPAPEPYGKLLSKL